MIPEKIETWFATYKDKLADSMRKHPDQYMNKDADFVAGKVRDTLTNKSIRHISIDTPSWKATAKFFGISNTYKAWDAWFKNA